MGEKKSTVLYDEIERSENDGSILRLFGNRNEKKTISDFNRLARSMKDEYDLYGKCEIVEKQIVENLQKGKELSYFWLLLLREVQQEGSVRDKDKAEFFFNQDFICDEKELLEIKDILKSLQETENKPSKMRQRSDVDNDWPFDQKIKTGRQEAEQPDQKIKDRRQEAEQLDRKLRDKKQELAKVQQRLEELDQNYQERWSSIQQELNRNMQNEEKYLRNQMNVRIAEERAGLEEQMRQEIVRKKAEALKAITLAKEEELASLRQTVIYQEQKEYDTAYLERVSEDINRRREFEDELCNSMRGVSREFSVRAKEVIAALTEKVEEQMKEFAEQTDRLMRNSINEVVNAERKIKKDDFEDLLHSFTELQQLIFFNSEEEPNAANVPAKLCFYDWAGRKIVFDKVNMESYLRRFLRVLNRLGYREYIPEPGEAYDTRKHEALAENPEEELPENLEGYSVKQMISCGFYQGEDEYMPVKAVVTVRKGVFR